MGSATQAATIAELKQQIADRERELKERKESEQERKYENLEEEVKDIRKRLVSKLFEEVAEIKQSNLELQIYVRNQESDSKKSNVQLAGGGVSIVLVLEAVQYYLTHGGGS